jgi:hypothetical protein
MQSELECLQDDGCVMDMERLIDLRIRQVGGTAPGPLAAGAAVQQRRLGWGSAKLLRDSASFMRTPPLARR